MKSTDATMSLREAAQRLGIGTNQAYRAAKTGDLPTIRIGKLILVPVVAFEKMLADAAVNSTRARERAEELHNDIAAIKLEHARAIENTRLERLRAEEKRQAEKAIEREKNAKVFIAAKVPGALKEALVASADNAGRSVSREIEIAVTYYLEAKRNIKSEGRR